MELNKINNPISSAFYGRVSSIKQREEGTIESQIEELKKAIHSRGDTLECEYIDNGYSGELESRPALDQMLQAAKQGLFKRLYVTHPDRLARAQHVQAFIVHDLKKYGVEIVFTKFNLEDNAEGQLMLIVLAAISEYEKKHKLRRAMTGKLFKVRSGKLMGNEAPYGYMYIRDSKSRTGEYRIDEKEAETIKLIFELYASGNYGYGAIIKELARRDIKSKTGNTRWAHSTLSRILSDTTYYGLTFWGKSKASEPKKVINKYQQRKNTSRVIRPKEEWIPIEVPAIISKELFDKTQRIKGLHFTASARNIRREYLLNRLIECASCNVSYHAYSAHKASYYRCNSRKYNLRTECPQKYLRSETIDSIAWNKFKEILQSPGTLSNQINKTLRSSINSKNVLEGQLTSIKNKLAKIELSRSKLLDLYQDNLIDKSEFKSRVEKSEQERKNLLKEKVGLEGKASSPLPQLNSDRLGAFFNDIIKEVDSLDFNKKQRIIRAFINKIQVYEGKAVVNCSLPVNLSSSVVSNSIAS